MGRSGSCPQPAGIASREPGYLGPMGMASRTRTFVGTNVARDRDDRVSAALRQDCAGCGQEVNAFLGGAPANSEYEGAVEGVEPSPPGTHGFRVLGHDCRPTRALREGPPRAH